MKRTASLFVLASLSLATNPETFRHSFLGQKPADSLIVNEPFNAHLDQNQRFKNPALFTLDSNVHHSKQRLHLDDKLASDSSSTRRSTMRDDLGDIKSRIIPRHYQNLQTSLSVDQERALIDKEADFARIRQYVNAKLLLEPRNDSLFVDGGYLADKKEGCKKGDSEIIKPVQVGGMIIRQKGVILHSDDADNELGLFPVQPVKHIGSRGRSVVADDELVNHF